jgi:hypothetical protein
MWTTRAFIDNGRLVFRDKDALGTFCLSGRFFGSGLVGFSVIGSLVFMDLGGFSDLEYGTDFQTIGCWFSKGYRTYLIGVRAFLRIGPFGFSGYWISPVFQ